MRAVVYDRFGPPDVLHVADVDEPVPRANELLVEVAAASLNPLDWKIRAGHVRLMPMFARPPRITGCDFAGTVVGVGGGAGPRHVGERIFGWLAPFGRAGSCAQRLVVAAHRVAPVPAGIDDASAAALPMAGGTAVQALMDDAGLQSGQRILITGAAGGVGHFAVQVARHLGAEVVATCSGANIDFVRSLGAHDVVDYRNTDWIERVGDGFDLVFDVADVLGWPRARRLLKTGGRYTGTGGSTATAVATIASSLVAPWFGMRSGAFVLRGGGRMAARLADLAHRRAIVPHVERRVSLHEVVDAQRAMETGHGRGKIVVLPAAG